MSVRRFDSLLLSHLQLKMMPRL